jgi:uncharacterized protein YcbK (DUF882 family)
MQYGLDGPSAGRRRALRVFGWAALSLALPFSPNAWAAAPRSITLHQVRTGERFDGVYFEQGEYVPEAVEQLSRLLRDVRTGEVCAFDPKLFDLLNLLNRACGQGEFEVFSGYRSPATNEMLRQRGNRVASNSLHLSGRAVDVRLVGQETQHLRKAALALAQGGVGFYPRSDFVHIDTGPVRSW